VRLDEFREAHDLGGAEGLVVQAHAAGVASRTVTRVPVHAKDVGERQPGRPGADDEDFTFVGGIMLTESPGAVARFAGVTGGWWAVVAWRAA
jgi:hypothetical protein